MGGYGGQCCGVICYVQLGFDQLRMLFSILQISLVVIVISSRLVLVCIYLQLLQCGSWFSRWLLSFLVMLGGSGLLCVRFFWMLGGRVGFGFQQLWLLLRIICILLMLICGFEFQLLLLLFFWLVLLFLLLGLLWLLWLFWLFLLFLLFFLLFIWLLCGLFLLLFGLVRMVGVLLIRDRFMISVSIE